MTTLNSNTAEKAGKLAGQFRGPHLFASFLEASLSEQTISPEQKEKLELVFNFLVQSAQYAAPDHANRQDSPVSPDVVALIEKTAMWPDFKNSDPVNMSQISWDSPQSQYSQSKQCAQWLKRFAKSLSDFCEQQDMQAPEGLQPYIDQGASPA